MEENRERHRAARRVPHLPVVPAAALRVAHLRQAAVHPPVRVVVVTLVSLTQDRHGQWVM